jgi:hypothetical protein
VRASMPLLLLALAACDLTPDPASPQAMDELQKRASFDLNCPGEQLRWTSLGYRTRGVAGCGRQGTYLWNCRPIPGAAVERCEWLMNNAANLDGH